MIFEYKTDTEIKVQELEEALKEKDVLTGDAVTGLNHCHRLQSVSAQPIMTRPSRISAWRLNGHWPIAWWGTNGKILATLKGDKQFQEAVRLFKGSGGLRSKIGIGGRVDIGKCLYVIAQHYFYSL